MRFLFLAFVGVLSGLSNMKAEEAAAPSQPNAGCVGLKQQIFGLIEQEKLADAESEIAKALRQTDVERGGSCIWPTLYSLANSLAVAGRLAEAEMHLERALLILDKIYSPDDANRFRPLELLWAVQFQQKKLSRARQTFQSMRSLQVSEPMERAKLHRALATQLQSEGDYDEAESEYAIALNAWAEAGQSGRAGVIVLHAGLGTLYIRQRRFPDAGVALDKAWAVANSAMDAVPLDRVNILTVRATLYARQGRWLEAETDFRSALSLVNQGTLLNPVQRKSMLFNFGLVLRKVHRRREAETVERLAAAIDEPVASSALVDVWELASARPRPTGRKFADERQSQPQ